MTTQDHSSHADRIVATFADGEAARRASLGIEQLGIESSRVHVDAHSRLTQRAAESKVDAGVIERPRRMAVQGIVVGGLIGAAIGLLLGVVFDVLPAWAGLALFTIPGVILGALFGVITRLETNPEMSDTHAVDEGPGEVVLTIDLRALDAAEREAAVAKLRAEQPIRLVEA